MSLLCIFAQRESWEKDDSWAFGCIVSELVTGQLVNSRPRGDAIFAKDPIAIQDAITDTAAKSDLLGTVVWRAMNSLSLLRMIVFLGTQRPQVATHTEPIC